MKILKFGGTSISTPERILSILERIKTTRSKNPVGVVVSAFGGVTNQLIQMIDLAGAGDETYSLRLDSFIDKHTEMTTALTSGRRQQDLAESIGKYTSRLGEILRGVYLVRHVAPKTQSQILSYGERLSARIICAGMLELGIEAQFLDARKVIVTDDNYADAVVDFEQTNQNIIKQFISIEGVAVITGFVAASSQGETTLLGRSGSDYTAAIFGAALQADSIEIWTDVDGIMTANPRQVPSARSVPAMTYQDAMEMSHFGARVIFPPTIRPAMELDIPIWIKNSFNPSFPGTLINRDAMDESYRITGISSLDAISLIRIQGSGMIGKTGLTGRIFQAISRANVGVMLISLASSEQSLCFAVEPSSARIAKAALEDEFRFELQAQHIARIMIEDDLCIVAVVGENMRHTPGIAGKVFSALGEMEVNVIAIAQGSSERNISIVVSKADETQVMQKLHQTFFENTE